MNGRKGEPTLDPDNVWLLLMLMALFLSAYGFGWFSGASEATASKCLFLCTEASIVIVRPEGHLFDAAEWTCFCER